MATMQDIEKLAAKMAAVRDALAGTWMAQQEEKAGIDKRFLPLIRKLTAEFKTAHERVSEAVAAAPELFVKPRSVILHGIKAGFQKGKGAMDWDDDEQVVKLIKKHFPELQDVLIKKTEKPVKAAMNELPTADLKRIGVTVEDTGDVAFVKLADGDIAKMIKALLRDAPEEVEA